MIFYLKGNYIFYWSYLGVLRLFVIVEGILLCVVNKNMFYQINGKFVYDKNKERL